MECKNVHVCGLSPEEYPLMHKPLIFNKRTEFCQQWTHVTMRDKNHLINCLAANAENNEWEIFPHTIKLQSIFSFALTYSSYTVSSPFLQERISADKTFPETIIVFYDYQNETWIAN